MLSHSQFGEDMIIADLLDEIGTENQWCFECGAHNGRYLSNTLAFREKGWHSVLIERDYDLFSDMVEAFGGDGRTWICQVEATNLDLVLSQTPIPEFPDFGVIDIDGDDYWLWKAMHYYRPRILCIEFNPYESQPYYDPDVPNTPGVGQSAKNPIIDLATEKGYELRGETFCNLLFVDRKCLENA